MQKCIFCKRDTERVWNGMCQPCYRYFIQNECKLFIKPKYGEIKYVQDKNSKQYGQLICHECGKAFTKLQQHIYYAHNMLKKDYCDKWGLDRGIQLTAQEYHNKMTEYANKYNMGEQLKRTGKKTRFQKGHLNKYNRSYQTQQRLHAWGKYLGNKYNVSRNNKSNMEVEKMKQTNNYFTEEEFEFLKNNKEYELSDICTLSKSIEDKVQKLNKSIYNKMIKDDVSNEFYIQPIQSTHFKSKGVTNKPNWIGFRYRQHRYIPAKYIPDPQTPTILNNIQWTVNTKGIQLHVINNIQYPGVKLEDLQNKLPYTEEFKLKIIEQLQNLEKYDVYIKCNDTKTLNLKDIDIKDFIDYSNFYSYIEELNTYSFLDVFINIPKENDNLTSQKISNYLYENIKLLYPLYNTLKLQFKQENNK